MKRVYGECITNTLKSQGSAWLEQELSKGENKLAKKSTIKARKQKLSQEKDVEMKWRKTLEN